jgi:rhamnogalacturonyl hydrolase YesR
MCFQIFSIKCILIVKLTLCFLLPLSISAQSQSYAERIAETVMQKYPDSIVVKKMLNHMIQDNQGTDPDKRPASWDYEQGVVLKSFEKIWRQTGDKRYYDYLKKMIDLFVKEDGSIRTYELNEYNSDFIPSGRLLLTLYAETKLEKYRKAAEILRRQLEWQPRTKEGGFWHKLKYPYQMWCDGLYMVNPFYAEYAKVFNTPQYFNDIANQFIWAEKHLRDTKTGLLYHGWDESKNQNWANPQTGLSPEVWNRAMGWYGVALVEVLDYMPKTHPKRAELINILSRFAAAIEKTQDVATGAWYQIPNKPTEKGNYLEASGTSMHVFTLAKSVRLGYLDKKYLKIAEKGYEGILKNFIDVDGKNMVHLTKTCSGAGLGGVPYRSGTYEYYISEPLRTDDLKGIGAFIQADLEMNLVK